MHVLGARGKSRKRDASVRVAHQQGQQWATPTPLADGRLVSVLIGPFNSEVDVWDLDAVAPKLLHSTLRSGVYLAVLPGGHVLEGRQAATAVTTVDAWATTLYSFPIQFFAAGNTQHAVLVGGNALSRCLTLTMIHLDTGAVVAELDTPLFAYHACVSPASNFVAFLDDQAHAIVVWDVHDNTTRKLGGIVADSWEFGFVDEAILWIRIDSRTFKAWNMIDGSVADCSPPHGTVSVDALGRCLLGDADRVQRADTSWVSVEHELGRVTLLGREDSAWTARRHAVAAWAASRCCG